MSPKNVATSKSINLKRVDHCQIRPAYIWHSYDNSQSHPFPFNRCQYKTQTSFHSSPLQINSRSYTNKTNRKSDGHRSFCIESKYQSYQYHNPLAQQFQKAGGILYKKSVLTPMEFKIIEDELLSSLSSSSTKSTKAKGKKTNKSNNSKNSSQPLKITLNKETSSSVANNRMGASLPWDSQTVQMLQNPSGSISQLVNQIMIDQSNQNTKMILSKLVPVEIRVYDQVGAGMEWHVDDVLFTKPQIELVLTIENSSDCQTMWEDKITTNTEPKVQAVQTEPNSVILIQAGSVSHKVSSLRSGKRVILKFVFIEDSDENLLLDDAERQLNQFSNKKNVLKKQKLKRRQ